MASYTGPHHILVTTDLSETSLAALERAASIAERGPCRITLLYVLDFTGQLPPGVLSLPDREEHALWEEVRAQIRPKLGAMRAEYLPADLDVTLDIVDDDATADAICRYAADHGCDLIVIATHGRTALEHLMIGSVTEKVVRHAPCDVLTVRTLERKR
jgi:nucleotide-binding universal stress UspA family protein